MSNAITPAINSDECPGVVHRFKVGERASRFGAVAFSIKGPVPLSPAEKKAQAGSVVQLFIGVRRPENAEAPLRVDEDISASPKGTWVRFRKLPVYKYNGVSGEADGCSARFDEVDSVWLLYRWVRPAIGVGLVVQSDAEKPDPKWRVLCGKTDAFFRWITTEPVSREATFAFDLR